MVDPYTGPSRGTTGRPQTASHTEVFDILRDTANSNRNGTANGAKSFIPRQAPSSSSAKFQPEMSSRMHAASAPALSQTTYANLHSSQQSAMRAHSMQQLHQSSARPHTQQDYSSSTLLGQQSTSRTFAERVNSSAARTASSALHNKCHKFGAGMPRGPTINVPPPLKTKLDFGNLFADQPDIGYFPVLKTGAGSRTASRAASRTFEASSAKQQTNDWPNEFLSSSARVPSNAHLGSTRNNNTDNEPDHRNTHSAGLALDTFRMPSGITNMEDDAGEAGIIDQQDYNVPQLFNAVPMFPSNESIGSTSYLSENRSIVHNKSAVVNIFSFFSSSFI